MSSSGVTRGVRWEHGERSITLEFEIDDDVRAKQIACELGEGFLCVQVPVDSTPPLLFGRLAQPVHPEVLWSVDEDGDGNRLLCIELEPQDSFDEPIAGIGLDPTSPKRLGDHPVGADQ